MPSRGPRLLHDESEQQRGDIMEPLWSHHRSPPIVVNLSIKNVPDYVAQGLRERAARNHRSLQKELLVIVEAAVGEEGCITVDRLLAGARARGLTSSDEASAIVRASRDRHSVDG
jgi:antitoxin FitA